MVDKYNQVEVRLVIDSMENDGILADQVVAMSKEEAYGMLMAMNGRVNSLMKKRLQPPVELLVNVDSAKLRVSTESKKDQVTSAAPPDLKEMVINEQEVMHNVSEAIKGHDAAGSEDNPFANDEFYKKSKLVAFKCAKCEDITIRRLTLAENNKDKCRLCGYPVKIESVTKVELRCPSCDDRYTIISAGKIDNTNCRSCSAPIDIVYFDKGRKAASFNLVK